MGKNGYVDAMQMPSSTNAAGSAAGNIRDADSFSLGHVLLRWLSSLSGCGMLLQNGGERLPAAVGNFLWRPQGWPGRFIAWIWMRTDSCPD